MYRIYERFAHVKNKTHRYSRGIAPPTTHPRDFKVTLDMRHSISTSLQCLDYVWAYVFSRSKILRSGSWRRWCLRATAAATDVSLLKRKRRCVWSASHSFIPVHVGKKRWTTATAAIVLCYSQTPVITVRFCTFIQFWYLTEFFGEMSCVLHM